MVQKTQKKASFFDCIEKNLTLEANETEQTDNKESGADISSDKELDDQLNSLKSGGDSNAKPDSSDSDSNSPSDSSDMLEDNNDSGKDEETTDSSSGVSDEPSESGGSDQLSTNGQDEQKHVGSAPRKLIIYAELTRLYNVVKESLDALEQNPSENSNIKYCVAQLQSILTDTQFILQSFTDKSEEDCHVQFHLIKKRISLVLELLSRQTKKQH